MLVSLYWTIKMMHGPINISCINLLNDKERNIYEKTYFKLLCLFYIWMEILNLKSNKFLPRNHQVL